MMNRSLSTRAVLLMLAVVAARSLAQQPAPAQPEGKPAPAQTDRVLLKNWARIVFLPMPQAKSVAVSSTYDVGFMDEQKGLTQVAHLLEHLVTYGATHSYRERQAHTLITQEGVIGAEAMPTWTHYDYVVKPDRLDAVLMLEAERLTSLRLNPPLARTEIDMCYAEAEMATSDPNTGVVKFAFMAFNQAWQHGADKVSIRGGLHEHSLEEVEAFRRSFYRPERLTLVIAGAFDRAAALANVEKLIGAIPSSDTSEAPPQIDWAKLPKSKTVTWDLKVPAVCVAFPPPAGGTERLALSMWGNLVHQKLITDPDVQRVAQTVLCNSPGWPVGPLPFFVYAAPRTAVSPQEVADVLQAKLRAFVQARPEPRDALLIASSIARVRYPAQHTTWERVQQEAKAFAAKLQKTEDEAVGIVLGNIAVQIASFELMMADATTDDLDQFYRFSATELEPLIKNSLNPDQMFVTILQPE